MWKPNDHETQEPEGPRTSTGSEVAVMSEMLPPEVIKNLPTVGSMNVTKNSRVHIGHKFVSVNQNINNTEIVKDVPFPSFVWNVIKNTTRAERLSCAAAILALLLCTSLIAYFTVVAKRNKSNIYEQAHDKWNITREMWLARYHPTGNVTQDPQYSPLKLVIVQHTVSPECHTVTDCASELRNLQNYYLDSPELGYDLGYNFVVGNEGRVYQIRGWNTEGAHTKGYNKCSLGIGFIGDYRYTRVTDLQMTRLKMLLQEGVDRGFLRPNYSIVGAKDVQSTESPGLILYQALQKLSHFDNTTSYRGMNCDDIQKTITANNPN